MTNVWDWYAVAWWWAGLGICGLYAWDRKDQR